ncbi:hypothetical protein PSHT_11402 [Puccinia striiformis]|uniref:Uncharacterized protein n=1 Tax=Puccinia striiformis TaxID=27350 RepID=A0A2S4V432_9BASI|nr:hypothetical protein PSHT_11402 [Puccinia striiformis]
MMIQRLGSGLGHRPLVVRPRLTILRPAKYSTLQNDGRQILGSIEGGLKSGPAEPMPEDAKGQAVSALRRIGLVLRLAFYAGLGVCVTGTIGFVGLHLWIEYLELSPPQTTTRNDQSIIKYSWEDEIKVSLISGTPTLYSASYDRMIKVFNLESPTYSETLFGRSICLWTKGKKKAVFTEPLAHGSEAITVTGTTDGIINQPRWVTSIYCIPYTDLFVSGSWDGLVKIWRLIKGDRGSSGIKRFEPVGQINVGLQSPGFVNSLHAITVSQDDPRTQTLPLDKLLICTGLGQEHRLGRWKKTTQAKNICLIT